MYYVVHYSLSLTQKKIRQMQQKERKNELLPFVTAWMELETIMLSEISQVVKDRYHMISIIRRI